MFPLACLTLGLLLGLTAGLKLAAAIMAGVMRRLDELECRSINSVEIKE